jgi:alginate O-acetyltransferase complex protein AlgI
MLFSSLEFLLRFLPAVLLLYYLAPRRCRNAVLVVASLIFYAWGEPTYVVLLALSCVLNYALGLAIDRHRGSAGARAALAVSVFFNLSLLGVFKYADFLIATVNGLLGSSIATLGLPLPAGISFYTFKALSYAIDVYRGKHPAEANPIAFATYVSLFPELMAGPIDRYGSLSHEIKDRPHSLPLAAEGVHRFVIGLGKKVILADNLALIWEWCRTTANPSVLSGWLGIIAYALQLYFDFSGYSDMAIGLGRMLGFHFMENFDFPYISRSITEFWRRWHISMGRWFRDYVYIPIGGNRVSRWVWIRNVLVVWAATGLWHGASWNFAVWGVYFGVLLALEKLLIGRVLDRLPSLLRHAYTMLIVLVSWVIFALRSVPEIAAYLGVMFGLRGVELANAESLYLLASNAVLLAIGLLGSTPVFARTCERCSARTAVRTLVLPATYLIVLTLSVAYIVDSSFSPFLYFRF